MKKFTKLAVMLLVVAMAACVAAACGIKVDSIAIKDDGKPQTVFVLGQDLDLGAGTLTYVTKDGEQTIALNDPEIEVTGYDNSKLGEQTLTIAYGGKTTTLKVTVVRRMVFTNTTTSYFTGESFDGKGRATITRDNGKSFTVDLSDNAITIDGFNSSSPATASSVTVRYSSGDETYTDTIDVNFFDVESTTFTKPRKNSYKSYDTELDLAGGYIMLKGNNGALTRSVALTDATVTGFDPTAVTPEKREVEQEITATYAGHSGKFTITLQYSDVTTLKEMVRDLVSVDFSGDELPRISDAIGQKAIEAADLFLTLTSEEKDILTQDEERAIGRVAAVYGRQKWEKSLAELSGLCAFDEELGLFYWVADDYESTKAALELLDGDNSFVEDNALLNELKFSFYNTPVLDGTVKDYLADIPEQVEVTDAIAAFHEAVEFYECYDKIPEAVEASEEGIRPYLTQLKAAYDFLSAADIEGGTDGFNADVFYNVIYWREDVYDLLYYYIYYYAGGNEDTEESFELYRSLFSVGCLPAEIEEIYETIALLYNEVIPALANMEVIDGTAFFVYYQSALQLLNALYEETAEPMLNYLVRSVTFSGFLADSTGESLSLPLAQLLSFLRSTGMDSEYLSISVFGLLGEYLGNENVEILLEAYVDIILNEEDDYMESGKYYEDIYSIVEAFALYLTPVEQIGFLSVINVYYAYGLPEYGLSLADEELFTSLQVMLKAFSEEVFSENVQPIFENLLLAIEAQARASMGIADEEGEEIYPAEFVKYMAAVKAAQDALTDENDKEAVEKYLGEIIDSYSEIAELYADDAPALTVDEDGEKLIAELTEQLDYVMWGYYSLYFAQAVGMDLLPYDWMVAAYEKAETIVNEIITSENEDLITAYYFGKGFVPGYEDSYMTLESYVSSFRTFYIQILTGSLSFDQYYYLYDIYTPEFGAFLASASDFITDAYLSVLSQFGDLFELAFEVEYPYKDYESKATLDDALTLVDAAHDLTADDLYALISFLPDGLYFAALAGQYEGIYEPDEEGAYSETVVAMADAMCQAEFGYLLYLYAPDERYTEELTVAEYFVECTETLTEAVEGLSDEEQTTFNSKLGALYNEYLEAAENI